MYVWPVLLPIVTNREDLIRTVSLFDDDTGEALDVSGRTLAGAGDFTAANWTVVSGIYATASVTQLTIPDYPIGNELLAVALTVGAGLVGILPGDPVTISDAATGLNTMTGYVTSYAPATGKMVCQIGCDFQLEIRGYQNSDGYLGDGYGSSSLIGTYEDCSSPIITAQLGNMLTIIDVGVVQLRVPASTMTQLRHKTYDIGMTLFDGYDTRQLMLGKQPVQFGGVTSMPRAVA